jgi:hypothetical protein
MEQKQLFILILVCIAILAGACGVEQPPEDPEYRDSKKENYGLPGTDVSMPDIQIDSIEQAFDAANHSDIRIRWQAVNFIRDRSKTPFEDLKRLLDNPHDDVVCAALNGLRVTGAGEDVLDILMKTIESPVLTIKTESIIILGKLGPAAEPAVPAIREAMLTDDPRLMEKAAVALEQITGE